MTAEPPAVRLEDVRLFFGDTPGLDHVSFEVRAGETRVLFGEAGAGKTTLLKVALGLLKPDSGKVYLFGQDISGLTEQELFERPGAHRDTVPGRRAVRFAEHRGQRGLSATESARAAGGGQHERRLAQKRGGAG